MKTETRKYQLIGIEAILGSQPCSKEVRTKYLGSKAPVDTSDEDEYLNDVDEKGLSVFYKSPDGTPALMDYQIKGFLKAAGKALAKQLKLASVTSKLDQFAFVSPRLIPIVDDDGERIAEIDQYERPLRAETMRGPRTALAASERIDPPWNVEIEITLVENEKTAKSGAITFEIIEELLNYGYLSGLGQFRNGGFGRFDWKRI